jgi:hypothetical protein
MTDRPVPIPFTATLPAQQPGFRMRTIAYLIMPAFLVLPAFLGLSPPLAAQSLSPHEKMSEIYKIITLCPGIRVDRKALDRFATLNGIDLTPGSRDERWFLKRAAYDMRKLPSWHKGFLCRQGMTRYGPQGGVAKGIMLIN